MPCQQILQWIQQQFLHDEQGRESGPYRPGPGVGWQRIHNTEHEVDANDRYTGRRRPVSAD
jgi:hypothetical protein